MAAKHTCQAGRREREREREDSLPNKVVDSKSHQVCCKAVLLQQESKQKRSCKYRILIQLPQVAKAPATHHCSEEQEEEFKARK
jgi:hypothetical protein